MDEQLTLLLERAARYRSAARTVTCQSLKKVLLSLAADYVALVRLLIDHPGTAIAIDALQPRAGRGGWGGATEPPVPAS
jgi:hypothetical protein